MSMAPAAAPSVLPPLSRFRHSTPHLNNLIAVDGAGVLQAHVERDGKGRRRQDNGLRRAVPRPGEFKCGVTHAKPEFP